MFYSVEILNNRQHGVATIWQMATFGPNSARAKMTRKKIEAVNVPKVCQTIGQPPFGVPISLRLQGNLLYGVVRCHENQIKYVLSDMMSSIRDIERMIRSKDDSIDPKAGKASRNQLILLDDPNIELSLDLPPLSFDSQGNIILPQQGKALLPFPGQGTSAASTQLSPLTGGGSSSARGSVGAFFDLSGSSAAGSLHLRSPFGGSTLLPPHRESEVMLLHEEVELDLVMEDCGLEIDADGNIFERSEGEKPQARPSLPQPTAGREAELPLQTPRTPQPLPSQQAEEVGPLFGGNGDVVMTAVEGMLADAKSADDLYKAEASPQNGAPKSKQQLRVIRAKAARAKSMVDEITRVSNVTIKSWINNYVDNNVRKPKGVSAAEARRNADFLIFGRGIADVGIPTGSHFVHPLAEEFAGDALRNWLLLGLTERGEQAGASDRRRSASEAFELEEDERRVRQRLDQDSPQLGRTQQDEPLLFGQEEIEVGREPGSALSEFHSSVRRNLGSSIAPGSSVHRKGGIPGLPQIGHSTTSPLVGRGSVLPEIERLSYDNAIAGRRSDSYQAVFPGGSAFSEIGAEVGTTSRSMDAATVDHEENRFLSVVKQMALTSGEIRHEYDEEDGQRWIPFQDVEGYRGGPARHVAVQAFFHVLSLATKGAMKVEQDGQGVSALGEVSKAFGKISLGVRIRRDTDSGEGPPEETDRGARSHDERDRDQSEGGSDNAGDGDVQPQNNDDPEDGHQSQHDDGEEASKRERGEVDAEGGSESDSSVSTEEMCEKALRLREAIRQTAASYHRPGRGSVQPRRRAGGRSLELPRNEFRNVQSTGEAGGCGADSDKLSKKDYDLPFRASLASPSLRRWAAMSSGYADRESSEIPRPKSRRTSSSSESLATTCLRASPVE